MWSAWLTYDAPTSFFYQPIGEGYFLTGVASDAHATISGKKIPCPN
jgi:hypothetical protein